MLKTIVLSLFTIFLLGGCRFSTTMKSRVDDDQCIDSFKTFAYTSDRSTTENVLPKPSWKQYSLMPDISEGKPVYQSDVAITRTNGKVREVWIYISVSPILSSYYLIYHVENDQWTRIPANIEGTTLYTRQLFLTSDGNIWGQVRDDDFFSKSTHPILSRFNPATNRFELLLDLLDFQPDADLSYSHASWVQVIPGIDDDLWIFILDDGLYQFTPSDMSVYKYLELPDVVVWEATISPKGSLYFIDFSRWMKLEDEFWLLKDNDFFEYDPATRMLKSEKVPDNWWPKPDGMLFDANDRLWLGAIGYRDTDHQWVLLPSNIEEIINRQRQLYWSTPRLLIQSSDGRLWYRRYSENHAVDGTAWYNPESGKGCLFTNYGTNVVEDDQRRLWLSAGNIMYSYDLSK